MPDKEMLTNGKAEVRYRSETPSQTIGAFLMMHGVAPWEAEELLRWLDEDEFEVIRKSDEKDKEAAMTSNRPPAPLWWRWYWRVVQSFTAAQAQ